MGRKITFEKISDSKEMQMIKEQKIIIDRINELCIEKQMTYYALSYKSTLPLSTLMHILDGTTKNPGVFTLAKLCDGFEITLGEFFLPLDLERKKYFQ